MIFNVNHDLVGIITSTKKKLTICILFINFLVNWILFKKQTYISREYQLLNFRVVFFLFFVLFLSLSYFVYLCLFVCLFVLGVFLLLLLLLLLLPLLSCIDSFFSFIFCLCSFLSCFCFVLTCVVATFYLFDYMSECYRQAQCTGLHI